MNTEKILLLQKLKKFRKTYLRRYQIFALIMALSILLVNVTASFAFSWEELLLKGLQVIELSTISPQKEIQLGQQIQQQLINNGDVILIKNRRLNSYLTSIGLRLAQFGDLQQIPYSFYLVDNEEINAFATMGGFVYINTGLMKLASNEAELASVIAHEMGHIKARHAIKQMKKQAITQGILSSTGLNEKQAVQLGVTLALELPNSRQDEYEADQLGLKMLTAAGYAPKAMVDFMKKLQATNQNNLSIFSTHPNTEQRIKALALQISKIGTYQTDGLDQVSYQKILTLLK